MKPLFCAIAALPLAANAQDDLRLATWSVELSRDGPGVLLRDILKGEAKDIGAAQAHIATVAPDILLLTGFDTDFDGVTLRHFAQDLGYPYQHTHPGNSGRPSGVDMDQDGRLGEPEDAQSYGAFTGQGGMALLSKLPIDAAQITDFTEMLWRDLPEARLPAEYFTETDQSALRLSSHAHWDIPVLWDDAPLHLFAYHATAPVFDGPEDRNGRRNADETAFWLHYLNGDLAQPAPEGAFVILGNSNLDPVDGDGLRDQMAQILSDPRVQDPKPRSDHGVRIANADHRGDPALDTADWTDPHPGNLRVDYVLPSQGFKILDSGISWVDGFRHGLVWVDIARIP